MLSNYCQEFADKYNIKVDGVKKLVPNLNIKTRYVLHYINLQLYVQLALRLTKTYRSLKFKQSQSLKPYIDFNTDKRKEATNSLKKDFFKLMSNSVYGKTIEKIRKRIMVRIVTNAKNYQILVSRQTFVSQKIFSKNLVDIYEIKPILTLSKTIYVGMCILAHILYA